MPNQKNKGGNHGTKASCYGQCYLLFPYWVFSRITLVSRYDNKI
jgi:hypothetical protein